MRALNQLLDALHSLAWGLTCIRVVIHPKVEAKITRVRRGGSRQIASSVPAPRESRHMRGLEWYALFFAASAGLEGTRSLLTRSARVLAACFSREVHSVALMVHAYHCTRTITQLEHEHKTQGSHKLFFLTVRHHVGYIHERRRIALLTPWTQQLNARASSSSHPPWSSAVSSLLPWD